MAEDNDEGYRHSCTFDKETENKLRVAATLGNEIICDVNRKAIEEYLVREQMRKDCKEGILSEQECKCVD